MNNSFTSVTLRVALFGALVFAACRKDNNSGGTTNPPTGDTTSVAKTDEDSLKYLMYRIMQVTYEDGGRDTHSTLPTYFWYSNVPSLNPLSSTYAKAEDLLEVMKGYAKGGTSSSLDRYSFLDRTGTLSSALQDGVSEINNPKLSATGTYGIEVTFAMDQSYKTHLEILYADKNSPAGLKGLTRGDEITAINGDTALSYYKSSNIDKIVDAIYNSTNVTLTVKKFNGASSDYAINAGTFNINPVLFDTTYTVNGKKVGYFVFYTYTSTINSKGAYTNTKTILDALFSRFKGEGVTEMIVDLRYNGGGSVTTAEYLDSVLAPAAAANKPMYYYSYNDKLTAQGSAIGLDTKIDFPSTTGGFNLNNIFFITSRSTASASELTLNNLKPYLPGKVFTVGDSTYGKPVGFIAFTINKYDSLHKEKYMADLYAINFATENANHVGGYYSGIAADKYAYDYVDLPWGHASDANLKSIFAYLTNGSFPAAPTGGRVAGDNSNNRARITNSISSPRFNGMVDYRTGKRVR